MEPTWDEFHFIGKHALQSRRPTMVVNPGDVSDAILAGSATMATAIVAYANRRFLECFLDGSKGEALTRLAEDRGVTREPGAPSVGIVTLSRPNATAGAGVLSAGFQLGTGPVSGLLPIGGSGEPAPFVIITIDEDVSFGALELTKTVFCTARLPGRSGNVAIGFVNRLIDTPFDSTITVSNTQRFAGGVEQESDEDLRDRVRGFFLTQARGTIEALKVGSREVDGVDRVSVVVDESGVITVYVADAQGNSNDALVAAVAAELEFWRAAGDVVYVTGGVIVLVSIDLTLYVRTGTDIAALLSPVRQAVISAIGRLNPGEELDRGIIEFAARSVDKERITKVVVNAPLAVVVPTANQLLRTNTGMVNFS
jgi:uncharacterized phage protein gp47/JayE